MITQEKLKEYLNYNQDTGDFTWIKKTSKYSEVEIGTVATGYTGEGYIRVMLFGKRYFGHNLAWLYMTGEFPKKPMIVDHINRNPSDNSWKNLRLATPSQNACNKKIQCNNKTGYKGVTYNKFFNKYIARVRINNKRKEIGRFNTAEEAYDAYIKNAKSIHGEFFNKG